MDGATASRMASGGRPSDALACVRSSCNSQASASTMRSESSSSRVREVDLSACCRTCVASAPRPRSSAACARAITRWSATLTTAGSIHRAPCWLAEPYASMSAS